MRNITVSVDDKTHRLARIRAAELDTSVSALVREYLQALANTDFLQGDTEVGIDEAKIVAQDTTVGRHVQQLYEEARARVEAVARRPIRDVQELVEFRRQMLKEFFEDFDRKGLGLDPRDNLPRDELYDRARARAEIAESRAGGRAEDRRT